MKKPALQTLPDDIFACLTSRWVGGRIWKLDLTAVEWRVTGYICNDSVILAEIADDIDIHSRAASELVGFEVHKKKVTDGVVKWVRSDEGRIILCASPLDSMRTDARDRYARNAFNDDEFYISVGRYLRDRGAKSVVFAENYGGGVDICIATARVKAGLDISQTAQSWHRGQCRRYSAREATRKALMQSALEEQAVHIPILGWTRSFLGDPEQIRAQKTEILSPPFQVPAAALMQSAVVGTQKELLVRGMRTKVCLNVHDAMVLDIHPTELELAPAIAIRNTAESDYRKQLEAYYQREIPLQWECGWLDS